MPFSPGIHHAEKGRNLKIVSFFLIYFVFILILHTVPSNEWTKVVHREYRARIDSLGDEADDPDARAELFRPQIEWYRECLQAGVLETKKSGKFDLTIGHYARMVTNLVSSFFFVASWR